MGKMIEVLNLSTGATQSFMDNIKPEQAVNYCWYEEKNRMSEFHDKMNRGHDFLTEVTRGKHTLARGDWCTMRLDVGRAASPTDEA